MGKLFKRGKTWHAWIRERSGRWTRKSTHCSDKRAAELVAAEFERAAADPAVAAANRATTEGLLRDYWASRKTMGRSEATQEHVFKKAKNLVRLLPSLAIDISHAVVLGYVEKRLGEWALPPVLDVDDTVLREGRHVRRTSVKKELRVLKAALLLGKRNGLWFGDPDQVIPELDDDYAPRTRALTPWELVCLALALPPGRAAHVVFIVATGARWGESCRALAGDWDPATGTCLLRGSKTKAAWRRVPVRGIGVSMMSWALARATLPFAPWERARHSLHAACRRAGIPGVSPNDLRRTFATWLREKGVETHLIASAMGHTDSRMVERVYGRLDPEALGKLIEARVGEGAPGEPDPPFVRLQNAESLACCAQAETGGSAVFRRQSESTISREKRPIGGAQGRNRTADTGIFSPPARDDGASIKDGTSVVSVGACVLLARCGFADRIRDALAAIHGGQRQLAELEASCAA